MAFNITEKPRAGSEIKLSSKSFEPPVGENPAIASKEAEFVLEKPETQLDTENQIPVATAPIAPVSEALRAPSSAIESPLVKDELNVKIDRILTEGLKDLYLGLPEEQKPIFREAGEQAARSIRKLIDGAKATMIAIDSIIRRWLALLTGLSEFFLEQLVRVKTEKIFELVDNIKDIV